MTIAQYLSIETECEYEYCIPGVIIAGVIETIDPLQCADTYDYGVAEVDINIDEMVSFPDPDYTTETDNHGDYSQTVEPDLDYRVSPSKTDHDSCGVTSLDLGIIQSHILGSNCSNMTQNWQLIAADANGNSTISGTDLVELQKVILGQTHKVPSWRFVPTATYTSMSAPSTCQVTVPSYNQYIDLIDIDEDHIDVDFIGIKSGDVNGSCTDCNGDYLAPYYLANIELHYLGKSNWAFYVTFASQPVTVFNVELVLSEKIDDIKIWTELPNQTLNYTLKGNYLHINSFTTTMIGPTLNGDQPLFFAYIPGDRGDIQYKLRQGELITETLEKVDLNKGVLRPKQELVDSRAATRVFPNPSSDGLINIDAKNCKGQLTFMLFDVHGRLSYSTELQNSNQPLQVDLSELSGLYIWTVECSSSLRQSGKIVIHK